MTATLSVPITTSLIYKGMKRTEIIKAKQTEKESLIKGVAAEVSKVSYR
jgi:hypothetical protein